MNMIPRRGVGNHCSNSHSVPQHLVTRSQLIPRDLMAHVNVARQRYNTSVYIDYFTRSYELRAHENIVFLMQ